MQSYIIVCEGRSEFSYLQSLQSFLDAQTDDWDVPLKFIPKIPKNSDGDENGGGLYTNVSKCYRQQRKENKKANIEVWVDADIYVRQDSDIEIKNLDSYKKKPHGIPDFLFSFHNFEDFLALHLEDAAIQAWHATFAPDHVAKPFHSEGYMPRFGSVLPGYEKGSLDPDFITRDSLLRLKANLAKPLMPRPPEPSFRCFAQFLITAIDTAFPALLT